jgi:hypothetical protein
MTRWKSMLPARIEASLGVALTVLATLSTSACANAVPQRAATYAAAEDLSSAQLVPLAEIPHRLCVRRAQYTYLGELLRTMPREPVTDEPWGGWFAAANASLDLAAGGRPVTWKRDCDDAARAGTAIRGVLHALRAHSRALASLAGDKTFDWSGFQAGAGGAGSIAATLGASDGVTSAIAQAGNALASMSSNFVEWYRRRKLDEAVVASDPCMQRVFTHLRTLIGILRQDLELARTDRQADVDMLHKLRAQTPQSPAQILGGAFELAADVGAEFDREEIALDRYDALVQRLQGSHQALAQLVRRQLGSKDVDKVLADLTSAADDLVDQEWNR